MADFWLHLFDATGLTPPALSRFLEGVVFQDPLCRLSGLVQLATAAASWAALIGMAPPSPDDLEREIAERRRVEAELRKAEARYRTLVEQIPAVTFVVALDEVRSELYVSPQIEALAGYTAREWRDDPILWYERVHPDDRGSIEVGLAATIATGEPFRSEVRLLARDGRVVWVHTTVQLAPGDEGRPGFLQGIAFDITERKTAEETLRRVNAELETQVQKRTRELVEANARLRQRAADLAEADRNKDEFLAMLAHELRNPLAPVRNALQILRTSDLSDERQRWSRDVMDRQVRHMARLVDDLLDVARIRGGLIALRKESVDLAAVLERAVETARPVLDAKRHELIVRPPSPPVRLVADPTRLAQVFSNLLQNAAKYTDEGGRIELTAGRDGDAVAVRVKDNGRGIRPSLLSKVFDLFTQGDRSLARTQGGLGIGLTLVRSLVQSHGGTVEAFSAGEGQGSEFVVRLPVVDSEVGAPSPAAEGGTARRAVPARRILVVDDNRDGAESLALLLRTGGHEVRTAHDGPGALEAARAFRPHVVFLDIGLPGMDGYEVARRLRKEPGMEKGLLAALTGYGQEEDRRKAMEAGFNVHLVKPADIDTLQNIMAGA